MANDRCEVCDRPKATSFAEPMGKCFRDFAPRDKEASNDCERAIDWKSRALTAESNLLTERERADRNEANYDACHIDMDAALARVARLEGALSEIAVRVEKSKQPVRGYCDSMKCECNDWVLNNAIEPIRYIARVALAPTPAQGSTAKEPNNV